jgi:hypothetical protein
MNELPLNYETYDKSPFFILDHLYTHGTVLSSSLFVKGVNIKVVLESMKFG